VVLGPIAFVGLRGYRHEPDRSFRSRHGRYPSLKVLPVVSGGGAIAVSITHRDIDRVRMMYDPSVWGDRNWYRSKRATRPPCSGPCPPHRSTQFKRWVSGHGPDLRHPGGIDRRRGAFAQVGVVWRTLLSRLARVRSATDVSDNDQDGVLDSKVGRYLPT
jgi:hypothetical protein